MLWSPLILFCHLVGECKIWRRVSPGHPKLWLQMREIMLNRMHEICYTKEEICRFNMCNQMPKHAKTYHNKTHACLFFSPSWLLFVVSHVFFIVSFFDIYLRCGKQCITDRSSILAMTPPILELWQQIYEWQWRRISESHTAAKMDSLLLRC